ncbi:hypothetical protein SAMN05444481_1147 [Flavobacterium frigidimaris]|nr:hypothetical protein SAMN05444481_1147 [Flavobacterium frigidimaris]
MATSLTEYKGMKYVFKLIVNKQVYKGDPNN